ncbi:MAG: hypothetical protein FWG91_09850 [Lachnospiraceae bacterium]|nr:hypothetical protein [Lachnospiraceae bacterium]
MNLRLYMRGLGIGILVTTAILMWTGNDTKAMSDDEIRERARTLGDMINQSVAAHSVPLDNEEDTDPQVAELQDADPQSAEPQDTDPQQDTVADIEVIGIIPEDEEGTAPIGSPEDGEATEPIGNPEEPIETAPDLTEPLDGANILAETGEEVIIRVNSGDDSFRISSRLYEAGLVESASDYNQYLMDNGYSRRLRVGNHLIPPGADHETIALILTGR